MSDKAECNKEIKFLGEEDMNYRKPNDYAFLNWNFDNSMGAKIIQFNLYMLIL